MSFSSPTQCLLVVVLFLRTSALPLSILVVVVMGPGPDLRLHFSASPGRSIETIPCLCISQSPSRLPEPPQGSNTRGYTQYTWT